MDTPRHHGWFRPGIGQGSGQSLFSYLVPKSRTTEFFGFFGFIGKAAAVVGPFILHFSLLLSTLGLGLWFC